MIFTPEKIHRILLIIGACLVLQMHAIGQVSLTNQGSITIVGGTVLSVNGNFYQSTDKLNLIDDGAIVHITSNLYNNGNSTFTDGATGTLNIQGDTINSPNANVLLNKLNLNLLSATDTLYITGNNLDITNELTFTKGYINVGSDSLLLIQQEIPLPAVDTRGTLINEAPSRQFLASEVAGVAKAADNFTYTAGEISNAIDKGNLGLSVIHANGGIGGEITVIRSHTFTTSLPDGSINRMYRLGTTNNATSGTVTFNYFDNELGALSGNESGLKLFHSTDEGNTWAFVPTTSDITANTALSETVDDLNGLWTLGLCDAPDDLAFTTNGVICQNATTTLTATLTPADSYGYQWTVDGVLQPDNTNMINIDVAAASMAISLEITTAIGCTTSYPYTLVPSDPPTLDLGTGEIKCAASTIILDGGAGFSQYEWRNASDQIVGNSQTLEVSLAGDYVLTITNAGGCISRDTVTVSDYPLLNLNSFEEIVASCETSATLGAGLAADNPGASYLWTNEQGETQTGDTYLATADGNYSLVMTSANGCEATALASVSLGTNNFANLGDDILLACQPVILDAGILNATFLWSDGSTMPTLTVDTAGEYWVEITIAALCVDRDSILLIQADPPMLELPSEVFRCVETTTTTLDGGPGFETYEWRDANNVIVGNSQTVELSSTGNYTLTVSDTGQCVASTVVTISEYQLINLDSFEEVVVRCETNAVLGAGLAADNPGATFLWTNEQGDTQTGASYTATESGNYRVLITSANACVAEATASVTLDAVDFANLGDDISVACETVTLDAGFTGATYLWSDGSTNQTLLVNESGEYAVEIKLNEFCIDTDTIMVELLSVSFTTNGVVCQNTNTVLTATIAPTVTFTYQWRANGELLSENTNEISIFVASAPIEMTLELTSGVGCINSFSYTIVPAALPNLNLDTEIMKCTQTAITIDGGAGFSSYLWQNANDEIVGESQTLEVNTVGEYTLTITNADGCSASDIITVSDYPLINLASFDEVIVRCETSIILGEGLALDNPGATYLWTNEQGDTQTGATYNATESGIYKLEITSVNGCLATATVDVTLDTADFANLGDDIVQACKKVTLDAGFPGAKYLWSNGSTNQTLTVDKSGEYWVEIEVSEFCIDRDIINVELLPTLDSAFFLSATEGYIDEPIVFIGLTDSPPTAINWDFGDGTTKEDDLYQSKVYASAGGYDPSLTTQFQEGCEGSYSKRITILGNKPDSAARISNEGIIKELKIFPNPNDGRFKVELTLNQSVPVSMKVIQIMSANLVDHVKLKGEANYYYQQFNYSNLTTGAYQLIIQAGDETRFYRMVILN